KFVARDPDNAVANLAVASAFEHERRHFHDWLLSPYTTGISQIRSEVFANYAALRGALLDNGTTIIPVPLSRWLEKPESEQRSLVGMWQSLLGDATRVQLPDFSAPGIVDGIEAITRRYRSIGIVFEPVAGTPIDAAAVFEASALLTQIQAVH